MKNFYKMDKNHNFVKYKNVFRGSATKSLQAKNQLPLPKTVDCSWPTDILQQIFLPQQKTQLFLILRAEFFVGVKIFLPPQKTQLFILKFVACTKLPYPWVCI